MVDHTVNVTLNLPEYCLPQSQQLMAWLGEMVRCVMIAEDIGRKKNESDRKPKF